jgi:hypothetical protein
MFSWANLKISPTLYSTVALAVVREIADRRCARSPDAPIRLPTKSASTKRSFHLQHVANLKNLLE